MDLRIPHDAWVIVCDARKAIFLRNEGSPTQPKLAVEQVKEASANPLSVQQGTDRPGRIQNARAPTSATEETDWHDMAEKQFARDTAAALKLAHQSGHPKGLVLVAPPRILAVLRQHLNEPSRFRILAEVDKDLTKHPIHEIERLLSST
ncbi:MAG: host attachment family protein [Bosea sp. (in: a-proteobacteria)]|nr:host attachment family protein [Bosea sp. (in: a-proteobacteria)]